MGLGSSAPIKKTVVVVGGGYAGLAIAQALDAQLDVVVIEKKEVRGTTPVTSTYVLRRPAATELTSGSPSPHHGHFRRR